MKILVLGGIGDARELAIHLIPDHDITYSIAGIVRKTILPCKVISGGFSTQKQYDKNSGARSMYRHLEQETYDLVIDATHPYAMQISANAVLASKHAKIPLWCYLREPWAKTPQDNWHEFDTLNETITALAPFINPFFTTGREVLKEVDRRLRHQHWIVRTAGFEQSNLTGVTALKQIGPFLFEDEMALFERYGVDVLVTKNSGGDAVVAKLYAARQLELPVYLLKRPYVESATRCFSSVESLLLALSVYKQA